MHCRLGRPTLRGGCLPFSSPLRYATNFGIGGHHSGDTCPSGGLVQLYVRALTSLTCLQGSHVTSAPGTYILQWRHLEGPQHHPFEFPLAPHKAKVMYYYEVLKSQDYKGSVSSLQSSHSGNTCNSSSDHSSGLSSCPSR